MLHGRYVRYSVISDECPTIAPPTHGQQARTPQSLSQHVRWSKLSQHVQWSRGLITESGYLQTALKARSPMKDAMMAVHRSAVT